MAAQTGLPRWRGFNLLELFSRAGPEDRRSGAFREDDFRWIADWGFDFVRIPLVVAVRSAAAQVPAASAAPCPTPQARSVGGPGEVLVPVRLRPRRVLSPAAAPPGMNMPARGARLAPGWPTARTGFVWCRESDAACGLGQREAPPAAAPRPGKHVTQMLLPLSPSAIPSLSRLALPLIRTRCLALLWEKS